MPIDPATVLDLRARIDVHRAAEADLATLEQQARAKRAEVVSGRDEREKLEGALVEYVLRDVDPAPVVKAIEDARNPPPVVEQPAEAFPVDP